MDRQDTTLQGEVWHDCITIILDLFEDCLLPAETDASRKNAKSVYADTGQTLNDARLHARSSSPPVKRKRSFSDSTKERKIQRLTTSLANNIARSLTVNDHHHLDPFAGHADLTHDIDMPHLPDPSLPPASEQASDLAPIPALQRISQCGADSTTLPLHRWLSLQAQRQGVNANVYILKFNDHKKQLHGLLSTLRDIGNDRTKTDDQRFYDIQLHLKHILILADDLCGDHSLAFTEIFPEWMLWEGHVHKIAAYVQSVQDMKKLVVDTIPRTDDLLHDVTGLQSVLNVKLELYGDNLAQNGLAWKAMGLPVDESLLARVKDWFFGVCIGLLNELDTAYAQRVSLVSKTSDPVRDPADEKLMEAMLIGLEFTGATFAFVELPSSKLIDRCWIIANIYSDLVSEHLEELHEAQIASTKTIANSKESMDVKPSKKPIRADMRLLKLMDGFSRILKALQALEDFREAVHSPGADGVMALDDFASTSVEVIVRAIAVIETSLSTTARISQKQANAMADPQTTTFYMQEAVLRCVEGLVELSGRGDLDGTRLKALKERLNPE